MQHLVHSSFEDTSRNSYHTLYWPASHTTYISSSPRNVQIPPYPHHLRITSKLFRLPFIPGVLSSNPQIRRSLLPSSLSAVVLPPNLSKRIPTIYERSSLMMVMKKNIDPSCPYKLATRCKEYMSSQWCQPAYMLVQTADPNFRVFNSYLVLCKSGSIFWGSLIRGSKEVTTSLQSPTDNFIPLLPLLSK